MSGWDLRTCISNELLLVRGHLGTTALEVAKHCFQNIKRHVLNKFWLITRAGRAKRNPQTRALEEHIYT